MKENILAWDQESTVLWVLIGCGSNLDLVSKDTMTACHVIRGKLHTFQATAKYDNNSMMNEFKNLYNYHMVYIDVYRKILYYHFYLVMYYNIE